MQNSRFEALKLLNRMSLNAFSNILLDKTFENNEFDVRDKKFISNLFYGVIERQITLDFIIQKYSSKPINKIDNDILNILRLGIYQIIYMDSVPDNAAVNESVNLTKLIHKKSASGFVNALLRNFLRDDKKIDYPKKINEKFSVMYSCPLWLVDEWIKSYGEDNAEDIMKSTVTKPNVTVRVNSTKTNSDELIEILKSEVISAEKHDKIDNCLILSNTGDIEKSKAFMDGLFHVQDVSSQLCCMALNPQENDLLLDLCAAPGGKSFTLSELMHNKGKIMAFDLHQKRVNLIENGAKRLSLTNIICLQGNAKEFDESMPLADKILCDVPCAGLGVIAKKPEIKYKSKEELESLPKIQYDILENAVKYLKIGGELVYSTCSLSVEENDKVIEKLLSESDEFEPVKLNFLPYDNFNDFKKTIFPSDFESDGFFISKIRRIK